MPHTVLLRSAEIYRKLRKKGITIRKPLDCMTSLGCDRKQNTAFTQC